MVFKIGDIKIHILVGDITTINTKVIVNAANKSLLGGGGVDGAIHRAGGLDIYEECKLLRDSKYPDGLATGEAVITNAGNLKARYIIHTVGPVYRCESEPSKLLGSCYKKSLLLADRYKCDSIAFPAISTGVYGYPFMEASEVAYKSVIDVIKSCNYIKNIAFVFTLKENADIMKKISTIYNKTFF